MAVVEEREIWFFLDQCISWILKGRKSCWSGKIGDGGPKIVISGRTLSLSAGFLAALALATARPPSVEEMGEISRLPTAICRRRIE